MLKFLKLHMYNTKIKIQEFFNTVRVYLNRNHIILSDFSRKTDKKIVNLHYWKDKNGNENLGYYLSTVVVGYYSRKKNIAKNTKKYNHLYAIGSILGFGCQSAVVWGSGLLSPYNLYLSRMKLSNLDVRCVRGPKTREELLKLGIYCPPIYGDPAILMTEIYSPKYQEKVYDVSLITHFSQNSIQFDKNLHRINMLTDDYEFVIDEIVKSKKIISSSLHGIILAEIYNVPAVLLLKKENSKFKYEDYYFSTGRNNIVVAENLNEALLVTPMPIPCFDDIRKNLKDTFPIELWK